MAKVYEALRLAQDNAPEATKQFLNDYNFSDVVPPPPAVPDENDPLDLAALGLEMEQPQVANIVGTDVAVAEAIADSVTTLANSIQPESATAAASHQSTMSTIPSPPAQMEQSAAAQTLVPEAYRAEFRQLAEIVRRTASQRTLQTIVVCGLEPSDQADFVVTNLSLALAENTAVRVACFSLVSPMTPVSAPTGEESFRIKIHRTEISNLCEVVPLNGPLPLHHLLRECDVPQMLAMLRNRFDFILLQTDAVNFTDEVAALAGQTDGVILIAQKEHMRGPAMTAGREKLQAAGAKILGAVLNRNREEEPLQRVA